MRDSEDRLVPIPRVSGCPISLHAFLADENLSLNPEAPREPTTFQPLSETPHAAAAAAVAAAAVAVAVAAAAAAAALAAVVSVSLSVVAAAAPAVPTLRVHARAAPNELLLMQTARLRREQQQRSPGASGGPPPSGPPPLSSCLEDTEARREGFIVAVDAEFVAEVTEAAEIDEEGHKHVLQSSSLALARSDRIEGLGFRV